MYLKQLDKNLDRYHYTIEDTGIRLVKKRLASSSDTFVEFEDVGSKTIRESSRKLIWLIIAALFFIIGTAVLFKRLGVEKLAMEQRFSIIQHRCYFS
jgi:hypothetical protein